MEPLLTLFDQLTAQLQQLTALAQRKTSAVRKNDLLELDQILKEEQAQSLALRGLEQKRISLLQQSGLQDLRLTELPAKAPAHLQQQFKVSVEALRREFAIYQSAAEVARNTLECNLHEVEKFLEAAGANPNGAVEAPTRMKSDFRA